MAGVAGRRSPGRQIGGMAYGKLGCNQPVVVIAATIEVLLLVVWMMAAVSLVTMVHSTATPTIGAALAIAVSAAVVVVRVLLLVVVVLVLLLLLVPMAMMLSIHFRGGGAGAVSGLGVTTRVHRPMLDARIKRLVTHSLTNTTRKTVRVFLFEENAQSSEVCAKKWRLDKMTARK